MPDSSLLAGLSALVVGAGTAVVGIYTAASARRQASVQSELAHRQQEQQSERDRRHQDLKDFDAVTAQLREQLETCREDLAGEKAAREAIVHGLQGRLLALTRYVRTLVTVMHRSGIDDIPVPPDDVDIPIW